MPNIASVLKLEVQRLAKKEIRSQVSPLKKLVSQHRSDIAELKRQSATLKKRLAFLEKREKSRLGSAPPAEAAEGSRFSVRSLKAQRRRSGLSQAEYAKLVGVSTLTINNWENGRTRPGKEHLASLVDVRGLGKREAMRRLELQR
ncbi:MAG: helix-turn-helix domain-containing protein [Planctomycetota bacterium]